MPPCAPPTATAYGPDLEQIPSNLQYAFICTEDKDFYSEPGVNFKRTIGAMINEYLLPIYSSKQGASTLEQQLIKNLTDDNSASGIDGALRKVREIYRALCLSRSYSKETILGGLPQHHQLSPGTIQGVQTAANEYFNKDVKPAHPLGVRHHRLHYQEPHQLQPLHQPRKPDPPPQLPASTTCGSRASSTEEEYRNAAAQPLVLAEEDASTKNASAPLTSYLTDALFNEVVQRHHAAKEGVD